MKTPSHLDGDMTGHFIEWSKVMKGAASGQTVRAGLPES